MGGKSHMSDVDNICGSIYTFCYQKEIELLTFLRNPDALKEQVVSEVSEQLDGIIMTMERAVVEWSKRRQAQSSVEQKPQQTTGQQAEGTAEQTTNGEIGNERP